MLKKNRKKRLALLLAASMLTLSLAGCGKSEPTEKTSAVISNETSTESTEETPEGKDDILNETEEVNATDGKIVLTDQIGREVTLDAPAKTIVSSYYISTTTLIAMGLEENLVGVEMKADEREIYQLAAPNVLELPAMGNKKNFNLEECAKLNPDLVILPIGLKDYTAQLEELKIPTLVVNPENLESFLEAVELFGKATGREAEAEKLTSYYNTLQTEIAEKLSGVSEKKSVYFGSADDVLRSATADMFQQELVEIGGGEAVFSDITGKGWTEISAEQLNLYNPDFIFMENHSEEKLNDVLTNPAFASVQAVADKNVYAFPCKLETWDTPSPSSILGGLWLGSVLYPEQITADEVVEEAEEFYKEFFDIEVTAEQLGL